jgi:mitochondrial import inner membrane translocase subunit TIM23
MVWDWDCILFRLIKLLIKGLAYGGVYGTYRGLMTSPNRMFKVQLNSVINQTTRYGPWAANSLGVIGNNLLI